MKRNQLKLLGNYPKNLRLGLRDNKNFLYALYNSKEFTDSRKWFDSLDCSKSLSRQIDVNMNLEKFLGLMSFSSDVFLKLGSPNEFEINYCAIVHPSFFPSTQFAWFECSYNNHNYKVISKLFNQTFGKNLDSFEVPPQLLNYHKSMFDHGSQLYFPIKKIK